jgi:hypothetical protein
VASLLDSLQQAGAHEQAAALADRAAAHAPLDHLDRVIFLLDSLRQAGAHEQAATLAGRLPAAGMFGLFLEQKGLADQFRFGWEADGTPAAPLGSHNRPQPSPDQPCEPCDDDQFPSQPSAGQDTRA